MNKVVLILALMSTSLVVTAKAGDHPDCCKPGQVPCCSEQCCKAADGCCKAVDHKACKADCKAAPVPKS